MSEAAEKAPVDRSAPFPARLLAYLNERFPPVGYGVLIISYVSSNHFLAEVLTNPGQPVHYNWTVLMSAVAVLCAFFHLRVFDEHKDYADDCRHYPGRVLQRGIVTLRDLKLLGALAIATEVSLAAVHSPAALTATLIALVFSVLMLREFFIGRWLRKHLVAYACSHMLVMPLFAGMVYSFSTGRQVWEAPAWFWVYAFVGFFVTFNWEISRKIRAPEQEREGVDSYTKTFGTFGAAWTVLAVRVVDTALVAAVGWHIGLPWWFYAALAALFVLPLRAFLRFRSKPSAATAKGMDRAAGIYIVAFDACIAAAIAAQAGLTFGGAA